MKSWQAAESSLRAAQSTTLSSAVALGTVTHEEGAIVLIELMAGVTGRWIGGGEGGAGRYSICSLCRPGEELEEGPGSLPWSLPGSDCPWLFGDILGISLISRELC